MCFSFFSFLFMLPFVWRIYPRVVVSKAESDSPIFKSCQVARSDLLSPLRSMNGARMPDGGVHHVGGRGKRERGRGGERGHTLGKATHERAKVYHFIAIL